MSDQYQVQIADTKEKTAYIKVLGCFSMEYDGKILNYEALHSQQLVRLFSYIVIAHNKTISVTNLCEMLWNEGRSDNPLGALKNLIYRLRRTLKRTYGSVPFIISSPGYYGWNPKIPLQLDMEKFEQQCKLQNDLEALFLYQGEVLKDVVSDYWAVSYAAYYHSLYLTAAKRLAKTMEDSQQYSAVERICIRALGMDALDEEMHCMAVKAMCKQGKWKRAKEYYQRVLDIYKTELGITYLPELEHCYKRYYEEEIRKMA